MRKTKKTASKPVRSHHRRLRPIVDLLKGLGSSTDVIAMSLQRLGVTGKQLDGYSCPLAQYFHTHHYPQTVAVLPTGLYDSRTGEILSWWPGVIRDFISYFDKGYYPQLMVKTEARR